MNVTGIVSIATTPGGSLNVSSSGKFVIESSLRNRAIVMTPLPITPTCSCAMPVGLSLPQRSSPARGPSVARVATPSTRTSAVVPEKMIAGSGNVRSDGGSSATIVRAATSGAVACCVVNTVRPAITSWIAPLARMSSSSSSASAVVCQRPLAGRSSNAPARRSGLTAVVTNVAYRVPSRRSSPLAGTPCSTRRVASYRHSIAMTRPRSGELGSTSSTTAASVSADVVAGIDASSSTSVTKISTSGRTPKPSSDDSCAATMSAWRSTSVSSPRSAARRFPSRSASVGNGVVP